MSQEKEFRRSVKMAPVVASRNTFINRTPAGSSSIRSSTVRMSMGGGPSYASGTLSSLSHKGVNDVIVTRDKEKKDMQGLNERFASYIEKVRFLEAQNKALLSEIERLKKLKGFDVSEIKEMYENELAECRNIIDDLSKEKAKFDSTLVGLQDALDDEKRERIEAEKENAELRNKLDRLNDQIGEYEGEVSTLRGRIGSLEDEVGKLRSNNKRLQDDICRLRADLDEETKKRIEAEIKAQAIEEDLVFKLNVADAEIRELTALIDRDKGTEMRDIWKGEMSKAVSELQREYDDQLAAIRIDAETRMESMVRELQAGVNRDNMEASQAKEEVKKLKSKLGGLNPRVSELEAENAKLLAQLRALQSDYDDMEKEKDMEIDDLNRQLEQCRIDMEEVMRELRALEDAKLSLELEISCYRKLLEGEEKSLKHVVESASGARSKGANQLADIVQKSSVSDSVTEGTVLVSRSCRGHIAFEECSTDGDYVILCNNTKGRSGKTQDLQGWRIRREMGGKTKVQYEFKNKLSLGPDQRVKLYASNASHRAGDGDIVCNFSSWQAGGGAYILEDKDNNEKASMKLTFST